MTADVVRAGDELHVFHNGRHRVLALADIIAQSAAAEVDTGKLTAPMPGKLIAVPCRSGSQRQTRRAFVGDGSDENGAHDCCPIRRSGQRSPVCGVGDQVVEGAELVRFIAESG